MDVQQVDHSAFQVTVLLASVFITIFMLMVAIALALLIFRPWLKSKNANAGLSLYDIIAMKFRRSNINLIIDVLSAYKQKGIPQSIRDVESFYIDNRHQVTDAENFMAMYERAGMLKKA